MIQSFDTQLAVVLRALSDVVAPALAGADKHVAEQLQLSLATLGFIATRLPEARRFYRTELCLHIALAEKVIHVAAADVPDESARLATLLDEAATLLASAEADLPDFSALTRRLREDVADLATAAIGKSGKPALDRLIVAESEAIVMQARLWCLPFGFELQPDAMPAPAW